MANRVLLGASGGSYKLLVSKPSYEVTSALTNQQLAFSSDWNETGNILQTGQVNMTSSQYVHLSVPSIWSLNLSVMAMTLKGGLFYPLNVLSCIMLGSDVGNHSVALQDRPGAVTSISFSLGSSGAADIVYYAIIGNLF
ncbi:hypothetical protein BPNPMPFG_002523 [Mesorhizobium sp. AR07]|uniref:hypothetical protein n=1 Tax=Mesorhizobium sp. AR07 TaxID=2865838 RepID=UPI002160A71E|nr:hypothetical protein [Mesorhizobium sp. AR07]UVK46813.1 hypothetical protein BPNPMPFG_002523 [Mesorhizobium sp. AR07]